MGAGHKNGAHAAFRRQMFLHPVNVRFLPGEGDARPGINAELDHLIAVIQQKVAEIRRGFPLLPGRHRQIKCHDEPAHFVFFGVHGL